VDNHPNPLAPSSPSTDQMDTLPTCRTLLPLLRCALHVTITRRAHAFIASRLSYHTPSAHPRLSILLSRFVKLLPLGSSPIEYTAYYQRVNPHNDNLRVVIWICHFLSPFLTHSDCFAAHAAHVAMFVPLFSASFLFQLSPGCQIHTIMN